MRPKVTSVPPSLTAFALYKRVNRYYRPALALLIAMYVAGLIGLRVANWQSYFLLLVPFNLVASAALLLVFHLQWNRAFWAFVSITLLGGYWVEVLGVHTGLIFGQYAYGRTLGTQGWGVPFVIGLNWLVLVYCTGIITARLKGAWWIRAAAGALLMVVLDWLIEPIAVQLDFWSWHGGQIPLQNYLAWFVIAWVFLGVFHRLNFPKENRLASVVYLAQLSFFSLHHLLNEWQ